MLKISLPGSLKKPRSQPSNTYLGSPNLLDDPSISSPSYYQLKVIKLLQILIAGICLTFLGMSAVSFILDSKLNALKLEVDTAYAGVAIYGDDIKLGKELERKIDFYKSVLGSRSLMGDNINLIFSSLSGNMRALESRVELDKFTVKLEGNSPLDFAKLIDVYLKSGKVDQIVIKSADLQRSKRNFKVELEGVFK